MPTGAGDQPSGGPSFKIQSDSRQLIGKSALANRYFTPLLTAVSLPTHSRLPGNHAPSLYFLAVSRPLIVSPSAVTMPQSLCPIEFLDETERNETHIPATPCDVEPNLRTLSSADVSRRWQLSRRAQTCRSPAFPSFFTCEVNKPRLRENRKLGFRGLQRSCHTAVTPGARDAHL
jgi:hypothetical protein